MDIQKIDTEKVAPAIEADAGETLPGLRQALAEAAAGVGRVTTSEQILVRQAREKSGLTQAAFAERIGTPVATLRDWEQGRRPSGNSALGTHRYKWAGSSANCSTGRDMMALF